MQAAHPLAVTGLLAHSSALDDPYERLPLTASGMSTIGFGSKRDADRVTARVRAMHRRVPGRLWHRVGPYPPGTSYRADDPEPSGSRVRTRPLAAVAKALNVSLNRLLGVDDQSERPFRLPQGLEKLPHLTSFRECRAR